MDLLRTASEKISENDLDFSISYASSDELGQLCASFETMREALSRTYQDLWRQAEEHKRLNAASTHNLRLPHLPVQKQLNYCICFSCFFFYGCQQKCRIILQQRNSATISTFAPLTLRSDTGHTILQ
ncbi:MAG: HAMP domain-containing protein [Lachnospiraceae bacterium]|nr:HAMP domain-containing protein [Lachnospiraceae bacterium]